MKRIIKQIIAVTIFIFLLTSMSICSGWEDYPEVYNLHWSNKTAKWSVDGWADKYEVRLYRDDRRVFTKTVTSKSKSFASEMTRGIHEYYFEVRPFNYDTGWGEWDQSDVVVVRNNTTDYGGVVSSTGPYGQQTTAAAIYPSGGPGEGTGSASPQTITNPMGQWVPSGSNWKFLYSNGVYASNSWLLISNKWYFVDVNTNMVKGLATIGNATYYFNPDGTMATGTIVLNGVTHFFNQDGKMAY